MDMEDMEDMKDMKDIDDKKMNKVTGGYVFNAKDAIGSTHMKPYEVIDDAGGRVLGRYGSMKEAKKMAKKKKQTDKEIKSWSELDDLRNS